MSTSAETSPRFLDAEASALLDNFSDDTDEDVEEDPRDAQPDPRVMRHENGVVGPPEGLDLVGNAKFKQFYAAVANDLATKNQRAAEAKIKSGAATHALQKQHNLVNKLRSAGGLGAGPGPEAALRAAEGTLTTKQQVAERAATALNVAEREASRAEVRLGELRERAAEEGVVEVQNKKLLKLKAATISRKRDEVHKATTAKRQSRLAAAVAHANRVEEQRVAQLETTMKAMKAARARVSRLGSEVKAGADTLKNLHHQQAESRAHAVVALKKNIDKEFNKIAGRNEKAALREAAVRRREHAEHAEILGEGRNPYEVFRRRKLRAGQAREQRALETSIRDKKMAIADRMLRDDDFLRKRDAKLASDREYEQSYKDSMKRVHKDRKVEAYMKTVTKAGTSMVDPTGRTFRLEPSKLTAIKDNSFGLGGTDPDVIRKLQQQKAHLRGVDPAPILLQHKNKKHARRGGDAAATGDRRGNGSDSDEGGPGLGGDNDDVVSGSEEEPDTQLDPAAATIYGSAMATLFKKSAVPTLGPDGASPSSSNQRPSTAPGAGPASKVGGAGGNGGGGGGGSNNHRSNSKLATRQLSVLEQRMVTDALARQKQNLVSKQVVWGKEFTGRAFLSKPDVIEFKDFVVGQKMRRSIVLTNVSYSFNTFKVLDLPDAVRDFFHIKYTPPGRMSAGTACTLQITFNPKTQVDIHSELPMLAQTGPFSVPIVCLAKKAKPVLDGHLVRLEDVVLCESESQTLTLENRGALDTDFEIVPRGHYAEDVFRGRGDEVEDQNIPPEHLAMLSYPRHGTVKSRKQRMLAFTFAPTATDPALTTAAPVDYTLRLLVKFSDPNCPDQELRVRVSSARVPIFVRDAVVDFRSCVVGKLYRCDVMLCNRGKSALKVQLPVNPYLRDALEFNPDVGFIQAATVDPVSGAKTPGSMAIQLKFRPTLELLERCAKFVLGNDDCVVEEPARATAPWLGHAATLSKVLQVPVKVVVPDQAQPVAFSLLAQLDESDLVFDPPAVDFGTAYVSQGVKVRVVVTSRAAVPQRFGFVNLPQEVDVEPLTGPATLLPGESAELCVVVRPTSSTRKDFTLTCRTSLNRTFSLHVHGVVADPPLQASQTVVKFRPVAPGDWIEQSIFLRNVGAAGDPSKTEQAAPAAGALQTVAVRQKEFEVIIPEALRGELKISPMVGSVAPGGSTRVEIEFSPSVDAGPADSSGSGGEAEGETEGDGTETATDAAGNDDDAVEAKEEHGEAAAAAAATAVAKQRRADADMPPLPVLGGVTESEHAAGLEPWSRHGEWLIPIFVRDKMDGGRTAAPMFVKVCTTTVQRVLVATPSAVAFAQVAVGNVETVTVRLQNVSAVTANLVLQPLNPVGPFRVVNAIRPLAAGASLDVTVQFAPAQELRYSESLVVTSQLGRFAVVLSGQGVSPVLRLTPEDGRMDLGHVLAGHVVTQTITLENTSVFPLPVSLVPLSAQPHTFSNRPVFDCSPCELVVAPNKKRTVTVTFAPDHEQPGPFHLAYKVVTPNENDAERTLRLSGHCWERQVFAVADDPMALLDPSTSSDAAPRFRVPRTLQLFTHALAPAAGAGGTGERVDPDSVDDPFERLALLEAGDDGDGGAGANVLSAAEVAALAPDAPLPRRLVLVFPQLDAEGRASRSVTLGSCALDAAAGGAAGTFALAFLDGGDTGGFAASAMMGPLASGTQTEVTFSFQQAVNEADLPKGPVRIAQWVERTVVCTLAGGFVPRHPDQPAGTPEEEAAEVEIVLRVFALR